MAEPLRALVGNSLDYAGLFPPARLPMDEAVAEYAAAVQGGEAWLVDRFVCPAARLPEFAASCARSGLAKARATVVGTPAQSPDDLAADAELVAGVPDWLVVEAYEAKLAAPLSGLVRAVGAVLASFDAPGWPLFVEVPWGPGMADAMHEIAESLPDAGFKLRAGGTEAAAFPPTDAFAEFLSEAAALDAPFKFTAGLHEPLRHWDAETGVWRFGFLSAAAAGCLAVTAELSRRELAAVLEAEAVEIDGAGFEVAGHRAGLDEIAVFRSVYGGFGSCSIAEPLEGLARLGLLEGVRA
jgi:hypothetical protein